jgi:nucleoside-diphosphate-sugar epimerase
MEETKMRVFLTGATGFIGSAVTKELLDAGHQVLGLARSDEGAQALLAAGAEVHRGDIQDLDSLRSGAKQADAVIHTAFIHDFSKFQEVCEADGKAIEALGSVLVETNKLLIVSAGAATPGTGMREPRTEDDPAPFPRVFPRVSEEAALSFAQQGVRVAVIRLPQVHDTVKQGLVSYAIQVARQKGVSAYIGEGNNRWCAAHISDTARLYRLALEKTSKTSIYHSVAEEGVPLRAIAEAVGQGLQIPVVSIAPEKAADHFGFLGIFAGMDLPASSAKTRKELGWTPTGPGLIADLKNMKY